MQYQDKVQSLDPSTIQKLTTAVEIGRWENGDKLTDKQRENAMQAVMLWQASHAESETSEPFKIDSNGQFKIGKGDAIDQVPLEYRSEPLGDIEVKTKN